MESVEGFCGVGDGEEGMEGEERAARKGMGGKGRSGVGRLFWPEAILLAGSWRARIGVGIGVGAGGIVFALRSSIERESRTYFCALTSI